jgi:hypothetical protein
MNAATGELNNLHKVYVKCVDEKMSAYLTNPQARSENKDSEFCPQEKNAYFTYMKANFAHQYENILRVEANTY